jgi:hypothetical protein
MSVLPIYVRTSGTFHSGEELEGLFDDAQLEDDAGKRRGLLAGFFVLKWIVSEGFESAKHALEPTSNADVWIYKDCCFRMALRVPGGGRFDTRDIELLCSGFCENRAFEERASRKDFIEMAEVRMNEGTCARYNL